MNLRPKPSSLHSSVSRAILFSDSEANFLSSKRADLLGDKLGCIGVGRASCVELDDEWVRRVDFKPLHM